MEISCIFSWRFMGRAQKTGEALHLFEQKSRKWELSLDNAGAAC